MKTISKTATAFCALLWGLYAPAHATWEDDLREADVSEPHLGGFRQAIPNVSLDFAGLKRLVAAGVDWGQKLTLERERRYRELTTSFASSSDPNGVHDFTQLDQEFRFKLSKAEQGYRGLARAWIPEDMSDDVLRSLYEFLENKILFEWMAIHLEQLYILEQHNPQKESLKKFIMPRENFIRDCGVFKIPPGLVHENQISWFFLKVMEGFNETRAQELFEGRHPIEERRLKWQLMESLRQMSDAYAPGAYKVWQRNKPLEADHLLQSQVYTRMNRLFDVLEKGEDGAAHYGRLLRLWWSHEQGRKPSADERLGITGYDALKFPHQARRAMEVLDSFFNLRPDKRGLPQAPEWRSIYDMIYNGLRSEFVRLWNGSRPADLNRNIEFTEEDQAAIQEHASKAGDEASAYAQTKAMQSLEAMALLEHASDVDPLTTEFLWENLFKKALFWWQQRPAENSFRSDDDETNRKLQAESEQNFLQFVSSLRRGFQIIGVVLWDRPRPPLILKDLEDLWDAGKDDEAIDRVMAVAVRPDREFLEPAYRSMKVASTMVRAAQKSLIDLLRHQTDAATMAGAIGVFYSQSQRAQDLLNFMGPLPPYASGALDPETEKALNDLYSRPGPKYVYDRAVFTEAVGHIYDAHAYGKVLLQDIQDADTRSEEAVALGFWAFESPDQHPIFEAIRASVGKAAGAWKMRFGDVFCTASNEFEDLHQLILKHQGWAHFRTFAGEAFRTLGMEPWDKENFLNFFSLEKAGPREAPFHLKKAAEAWTNHTLQDFGF